MSHDIHGPQRMAIQSESFPDLGRLMIAAEVPAGEELRIVKYVGYGWSRRAVQARPGRPGQRRARGGPADRLGRAAGRAARLPGRLLGGRRRRGARRRRDPAGGQVRPLPHPAGGRPGRAPAHPGQGPDRDRLRRAHLLGHRGVRPPGADLHQAGRRRRRAQLAEQHARRSPERTPRSSAWRARPSPGGPSTARSAPGTGRPAPPPSTSTPTSPRPSSSTATPPRTPSSSGRSRCRSWSRPPACGARSASTTPTASSASRASPAPTSTARSRTTTSTPT